MRKITKLSLVTCIAVASFSTANASSLEEAIKSVDISGGVVYNYENFGNKKFNTPNKQQGENQYKASVNATVKVNSNFNFNTRLIAGNVADADNQVFNAGSQADSQLNTAVAHANVEFVGIENASIILGKQGLASPFATMNVIDGNEQTGSGITASYAFGPATIGAGYYNQSNTSFIEEDNKYGIAVDDVNKLGSRNIVTVNAALNYDFVGADAAYINLKDLYNGWTIGVNGNYEFTDGQVGADVRYVETTLKYNNEKIKSSLTKAVVDANYSIVNAELGYAMTGKDAGLTALDSDAETSIGVWAFDIYNKKDAKLTLATLGVNVIDNLNISANYNTIKYKNEGQDTATKTQKENELYAAFVYEISKNLSSTFKYGVHRTSDVADIGTGKEKNNRGTFQVLYTF